MVAVLAQHAKHDRGAVPLNILANHCSTVFWTDYYMLLNLHLQPNHCIVEIAFYPGTVWYSIRCIPTNWLRDGPAVCALIFSLKVIL